MRILKPLTDYERYRQRARYMVAKAIRRGDLVRPSICSQCGRVAVYPLDILAHHDDYDRPLVVTWLCVSCHIRLHRRAAREGQPI